jgi:PCFT/HCP family folate transporter-like MFS transporter 1/3
MPECVVANVKIHVEIPLLLLFFAFILSDSVKTNLIIFRTCYVTLEYNKSECALLGSQDADNETSKLEKIVEPYAATLNMVHSLTEACFSAVICLFVGPWSDRFGRKPILIIPIIGYLLFYVFFAVFASLENISPWYSLVCSIPVYVTGGGASYLTVLLCYITDVTREANRGMRMGVFEAVLSLGILMGNVSSSYVFSVTNYLGTFLISATCCFLNVIFTVFLIPESLINPETEGRLKNLFQLSNITDMLKTTFKGRQNYDRFVVLCCVLMLTIYILAINGDGAVIFLFLRENFHWSLRKYTLFSAAHNVTWVLGTVIGVYLLHKLMKISEAIMIVVGFMSMLVGMLVMGLAKYDWEVYTAAFSRALGGVLSPMVRSLVSKIVPNEEVGKIFSLIVVSESLFGMGGSPIYTAIYNATILTNPAMFNFVSAGIYAFEVAIAITIVVARNICMTNILGQDGDEQPIIEEAIS